MRGQRLLCCVPWVRVRACGVAWVRVRVCVACPADCGLTDVNIGRTVFGGYSRPPIVFQQMSLSA